MSTVLIIGGGLAGMVAGIELAQQGVAVTLVERKAYPFHRVCGEYISNEVLPYLSRLGIQVEALGIEKISRLDVSSLSGRVFSETLGLGGFGLSRFTLDQVLYQTLVRVGGTVIVDEKITEVTFKENQFISLGSSGREYMSDHVIGAFGKRSNLDHFLRRPFFLTRSPYLGVKYHVKWEMPKNLIQLHNFSKGYAGISAVEDGKFCLCYLSQTENLTQYGTLEEMETKVLHKNPLLKSIFEGAEFLWDKPLVINEVSFAAKELIRDHILMCGDSAGLITPLCGNGMAIAIHSGKLVAECLLQSFRRDLTPHTRQGLELEYTRQWNRLFRFRLFAGRMIQGLFGHDVITDNAIGVLQSVPILGRRLIKLTHGKPF